MPLTEIALRALSERSSVGLIDIVYSMYRVYRGIINHRRVERGGTDKSEFSVCGTCGPMGFWVLWCSIIVVHAYTSTGVHISNVLQCGERRVDTVCMML